MLRSVIGPHSRTVVGGAVGTDRRGHGGAWRLDPGNASRVASVPWTCSADAAEDGEFCPAVNPYTGEVVPWRGGRLLLVRRGGEAR